MDELQITATCAIISNINSNGLYKEVRGWKMIKGYKYRIYPTSTQEIQLLKTIGSARKVYNLLLSDRLDIYNDYSLGKITQEEMLSLTKKLTPKRYKEEHDYLKEVDSQALSQSHQNLNTAYSHFFRKLKKGHSKPGLPQFKSKNKHKWSYSTCTTNNNVRLEESGLILPKIKGHVKIKLHRTFQGDIKRATVVKNRSGKWYVSLTVDDHKTEPETVEPHTSVGLDLGLLHYLITSDDDFFDNPKISRSFSKKLAREQRKLSKKMEIAKKKGEKLDDCSNYQKQKIVVAKIHEKIVHKRKDFIHKLSASIVKNHDIVAVESLKPSNMVKNRTLAYSIMDVSWSDFVSKLEYKCKDQGKILVKAGQYFPSSQLCSECDHRSGKKPLHVRKWVCEHCQSIHDRDVNAAKNILKEGLRILELEKPQELRG